MASSNDVKIAISGIFRSEHNILSVVLPHFKGDHILRKSLNTVLDISNLATVSSWDIYKYSNDRIKNHNKNK